MFDRDSRYGHPYLVANHYLIYCGVKEYEYRTSLVYIAAYNVHNVPSSHYPSFLPC